MENEEALIAENPLKEETEEKEIACKTCRFVLPPVQIWGMFNWPRSSEVFALLVMIIIFRKSVRRGTIW